MAIDQLSLVIPAYNEERAISEIINSSGKVLSSQMDNYEIIVVDDGSTDATFLAALSAGATVIKHPTNLGYGNSLKTGINNAKYDYVAICDADGTYKLEELKKLIPYAAYFDMVVGARTGKVFLGKGIKRIARWCQLLLVRFSTGYPVPDANSGLRIFRKENLQSYFDGICGGFSFTTSITLAMLSTGRTVKYVPIEYHPRIGKSHIRFVRDTLGSLQIMTHVILKYNPIKAFLSIMVFPFFLGVLSLIAAAVALLLANTFWAGFSAMIFVLSLLICILLFGMGMLAYATQQKPNQAHSDIPVHVMFPDRMKKALISVERKMG